MIIQLTSPYMLHIESDPFSFMLLRGAEVVLRLAPMTQRIIDTDFADRAHTITLESAVLTLRTDGNSLDVRWQSNEPICNAFAQDGQWYGQGELIHQVWPLNRLMLHETDFITVDNGETGLSCVLAPLWLSENGIAIFAHSPLRVGSNQPIAPHTRHIWTLGAEQAPFSQRPLLDSDRKGDGLLSLSGNDLHYTVFFAADFPAVHELAIQQIGHCDSAPPIDVISHPIWNTWARYHAEINQQLVLTYAREILDYDYPHGRFVIDDRWQIEYGDLTFDPKRFPDPRGMIDELHKMEFTVQTWVVPFLAPTSANYREAARKGYLVKDMNGDPYDVQWWQGIGGLLDVTHPEALDWFFNNLQSLQASTRLDGFKFDAGEAVFLPADAVTFTPIQRNEYTHRYLEFVGQHFAWSDVRSGWLNQRAPLLFRQWDKASTWGLDNGLHSVITGALSLSVSGYPLFLPDMIGGNAYTNQPDAELMIRWSQVNALMPGMQFSLAPWDYGKQCAELCRRAVQLHQSFAPIIHQLAIESSRTGQPIIRPIFWNDPHDPDALGRDDQFLLGDHYLIAPVITANTVSRDIYLPSGNWTDIALGTTYAGNQWMCEYPVSLDTLRVFEKE